MKKNLYKVLAASLAFGLMVATPMTSLTAHAAGSNAGAKDDTDYGTMPDGYWDVTPSTPSTPAPAPNVQYSGSSSSSYSLPSPSALEYDKNWEAVRRNPNDSKVNVGKQDFRSVMSSNHKQYDIYHKGSSVARFIVAGADGKAVKYSDVTVKAGDDGNYYAEITMPADVDVTDMTVVLTKGDASYIYTTLGVYGIKLNGEVSLLAAPTDTE